MQKRFFFLAVILCFLVRLAGQNNIKMTSYFDNNDNKAYYLVWDTKTGKSIQYYWNTAKTRWDAFEINLPESPLTGASGSVMMDVFYANNDRKAYYLIWDTKTGKSIQYYWNTTKVRWESFEINLPETPLSGAVGEIGMKMYYDTNDNKAYYIVWDTNTGRSIQYYWNTVKTRWDSFEINLPPAPLNK